MALEVLRALRSEFYELYVKIMESISIDLASFPNWTESQITAKIQSLTALAVHVRFADFEFFEKIKIMDVIKVKKKFFFLVKFYIFVSNWVPFLGIFLKVKRLYPL